MIIISNYELYFNEDTEIYYVIPANESQCCCSCNEILVYFDSCIRFGKREGGSRKKYMIRRLQCKRCQRIHRELIDKFVPYKQYESEIISGVIDDIVTSCDIESEDYPSEKTIERLLIIEKKIEKNIEEQKENLNNS